MRNLRRIGHGLRILGRLGFLAAFLVLSPVPALGLAPGRGAAAGSGSRLLRCWARLACRIFSVRIGAEGQPAPGPVFLVANHVSWLDILAVCAVAPVTFVAKAEVRDWPLLGRLAKRAGTVFLDRDGNGGLLAAKRALEARLGAGDRVLVFAEGTTGYGATVGSFHSGLFQAAIQRRCPVQPTTLSYGSFGRRDEVAPFVGQDRLVPHAIRLLGRSSTEVRITFHSPIAPECDRRALTRTARYRVASALPDPAAGQGGVPGIIEEPSPQATGNPACAKSSK